MADPANTDVYGYRWSSDVADINSPSYLADMSTSIEVAQSDLDSTVFVIMIGVENDGGMNDGNTFQLVASVDGGTHFNVNATSSNVKIVDGADDNGDDITPSAPTGFTAGAGTWTDGRYDDDDGSNGLPGANLANGNYTIAAYAVQFTSDLSGGESIEFFVNNDAECTNDVSPTATIASAGQIITPENASFSFSAQDVSVSETRTDENAQFKFTGQDLTVRFGSTVIPENASFNFSAEAFKSNDILKPENAKFSWTAQDLTVAEIASILNGSFDWTAQDLRNVHTVHIDAANFSFTGQDFLLNEALKMEHAEFKFSAETLTLVEGSAAAPSQRRPYIAIKFSKGISIT